MKKYRNNYVEISLESPGGIEEASREEVPGTVEDAPGTSDEQAKDEDHEGDTRE